MMWRRKAPQTAPEDRPPAVTAASLVEPSDDVMRTPWKAPVPGARRRPLVPKWVPIAAAAVVVVVAAVIGVAVWAAQSAIVRVPAVRGLDRVSAEARLSEQGLRLRVGDRRFSATVAPGLIVEQSPAPGVKVTEGSFVVVALSAGTEQFAMPDVVGLQLDQARRRLRERGLSVEVVSVQSDKTPNTVIESFPSAGVTVSTGDKVRVSVASGQAASNALLPSDLTGKTFVLDPAPMPTTAGADTTLDIARRLRALLEASGARVVVTREVTDQGDAVSTVSRARRAKEASSTALIGFSVSTSGPAGLTVLSLPATGTTQPFYLASSQLGTAVATALQQAGRRVTTVSATNDAILTGTGVPAVRVRLGSTADPDDKLTFSDPQWADDVARAVYRAIGSVYGSK